jgi:hypothetical protein
MLRVEFTIPFRTPAASGQKSGKFPLFRQPFKSAITEIDFAMIFS